MNLDGTPRLGSTGQPIPAYDQETVEGLCPRFTGWTYAPRPGATRNRFGNPAYYDAPMIAFQEQHDTGTKKLLAGVVLPAGRPRRLTSTPPSPTSSTTRMSAPSSAAS